MHALSRGALLLVGSLSPLVVVAAGCEDSSSSGPSNPVFEAGGFDAPTSDGPIATVDGSDGAIGDGGGGDADASQPYSAKATCDAPLKVVDYSGNDFASAPVFASAPGASVVAFFNRVVNATSDVDCELRTLSGTTWGSATTLQATTCSAITPFQLAAGGNAALAAWTSANVSGQRRRVTAAGGMDVGGTTAIARDDLDAVKMGAGGHGAHVWRTTTGVATMLIANNGTTTTLPENTLTGGVDGMSAAVDANGDGFAFWVLGSAVHARAWKAGAWASPEAILSSVDTASGKLDATILPGGDAYVVVAFNSGSGALRGAKVRLDAGASTFGALDDLVTGKFTPGVRVLAAADGELTALWVESDGSGNLTLTARRRSGATWDAAAPLGKHQWFFVTAAIDGSGHVTVGRNPGDGRIFHHRIGKGAATWSPAVRVDAPTGTGSAEPNDVAVAIEPGTGNPVIGWRDVNDLKFSICR